MSNKNKKHYPSRQSHNAKKLVNQIRKEPSHEVKTSTEDSAGDKWTKENYINAIGIGINVILAIVTFFLFYIATGESKKTQRALEISDSTLHATTTFNDGSLRIQKQSVDSQISAKRQSDITDAIKSKHDDSVFEYQKESLNAQITSIKENQKNFERTNRSYIQAIEFDTVSLSETRFSTRFYLTNIGQQPAKIIKAFYETIADTASTDDYKKSISKPKYQLDNTYIVIGSPVYKTMKHDGVIPKFYSDKIKSGVYSLYLHGKIEYINLANNEKSDYEFIAELNVGNGVLSRFLMNDNTRQK